jgi:hypothetical protein
LINVQSRVALLKITYSPGLSSIISLTLALASSTVHATSTHTVLPVSPTVQGTVTPFVSVPLIFGKCYKTHLAILDHSMAVLDGLGAACKIREIIPEVPILMLSIHDGHS